MDRVQPQQAGLPCRPTWPEGPGHSIWAAPSTPAACPLPPQGQRTAESAQLGLSRQPSSMQTASQPAESGACLWRLLFENGASCLVLQTSTRVSSSQAMAVQPAVEGRARHSCSGNPPCRHGIKKRPVHISLLNYSSPSPGWPALVSMPKGPGFMYFITSLALQGARSWVANMDGSRCAPCSDRACTTASRASLPPVLVSC